MTDLKHCKVKEQVPFQEKIVMVFFATVVIGGVIILNFLPVEMIK